MMAIKSRYSFLDFVQIARSIAKSISLRDVDSNEIIRIVVEERNPNCKRGNLLVGFLFVR